MWGIVGVNDIHAYMNAIYSMRTLKVVGAQMFGCQMFGLLKVEGRTFIPIKVRLLLFKKYDNFPF